jgi:cation transport regulator ChaB
MALIEFLFDYSLLILATACILFKALDDRHEQEQREAAQRIAWAAAQEEARLQELENRKSLGRWLDRFPQG